MEVTPACPLLTTPAAFKCLCRSLPPLKRGAVWVPTFGGAPGRSCTSGAVTEQRDGVFQPNPGFPAGWFVEEGGY